MVAGRHSTGAVTEGSRTSVQKVAGRDRQTATDLGI